MDGAGEIADAMLAEIGASDLSEISLLTPPTSHRATETRGHHVNLSKTSSGSRGEVGRREED